MKQVHSTELIPVLFNMKKQNYDTKFYDTDI
jgi:hypothetical protein